jgi:hypothetical protein
MEKWKNRSVMDKLKGRQELHQEGDVARNRNIDVILPAPK